MGTLLFMRTDLAVSGLHTVMLCFGSISMASLLSDVAFVWHVCHYAGSPGVQHLKSRHARTRLAAVVCHVLSYSSASSLCSWL